MNKLDFDLKARLMLELGATYKEAAAKLLPKKRKPATKGKSRSHWEKLTQGLCNAGFAEDGARHLTAAEFKRENCNRDRQRKAERKFKAVQKLAGKESRKASDSWTKAAPSTAGYWKASEAKPRPVTITRGK